MPAHAPAVAGGGALCISRAGHMRARSRPRRSQRGCAGPGLGPRPSSRRARPGPGRRLTGQQPVSALGVAPPLPLAAPFPPRLNAVGRSGSGVPGAPSSASRLFIVHACGPACPHRSAPAAPHVGRARPGACFFPYAPRVTTSPRCPFGPAPKAYASRCRLPNRLARVRRGLTPAGPSSLLNRSDSRSFTPSLCPHRACPAPARPCRTTRAGPPSGGPVRSTPERT